MEDRTSMLKDSWLSRLPKELRMELLTAHGKIVTNFKERRWETAEINGGKLCEIVYTILRGHVDGKYPITSSKPRNMVEACHDLEKVPATLYPRSVRIQIPRMLIALYEIRNNRGVGHAGGDVNPNHMDAVCVLEMSKWIMSELVRIFHGVSTKEAAAAVEMLVERTVPIIWEVGEKKRVLNTKLSMRDKALVILYHSAVAVDDVVLCGWVEHSNMTVFRRDILKSAHKEKLIEYDDKVRTAQISPVGIDYVETKIL
jgi:hypothetical protein